MAKYISIDNNNVESGTFNSCFIKQTSNNGVAKIYEPYQGYLFIHASEWSVNRSTTVTRTEGSRLSSNLKISDTLKSESSSIICGYIEIQHDIKLSKLNSDVKISKTGSITISSNLNRDIKAPYLRFWLLEGFIPNIDIKLNNNEFLRISEDIKQKKLHSLHLQLSELEGVYKSKDSEKLMVIDATQQIKKTKGSAESPSKIGEVGEVVITEIYESYFDEKKDKKNKNKLENQEITNLEQVKLLKEEIKILSEKHNKDAGSLYSILKVITFLLILLVLLFTGFISAD